MTVIIGLYAAFLFGMFLGVVINPEETCPAAVKGYKCKGDGYCDHRKTTLYQAHLDMAQVDEDRENGKETNLWGGDK